MHFCGCETSITPTMPAAASCWHRHWHQPAGAGAMRGNTPPHTLSEGTRISARVVTSAARTNKSHQMMTGRSLMMTFRHPPGRNVVTGVRVRAEQCHQNRAGPRAPRPQPRPQPQRASSEIGSTVCVLCPVSSTQSFSRQGPGDEYDITLFKHKDTISK